MDFRAAIVRSVARKAPSLREAGERVIRANARPARRQPLRRLSRRALMARATARRTPPLRHLMRRFQCNRRRRHRFRCRRLRCLITFGAGGHGAARGRIKGATKTCPSRACGTLTGLVSARCRGGIVMALTGSVRILSSGEHQVSAPFLVLNPLQQYALARANGHPDPENGQRICVDQIVDAASMSGIVEEEACDGIRPVQNIAPDIRSRRVVRGVRAQSGEACTALSP
jgi:hypothetical protein